MKLRFLLALLFVHGVSRGAITEFYVTDAGAGSGAGTSEANAMSYATFQDYMAAAGTFTAAAGSRFNIKGSLTDRTTTTDTWFNPGTLTSPIIIRGYGTTITDGYQGRNTAGALVTTNMPTMTYTTGGITVTGAFIIVESMQITTARSGYSISFSTGTDGVILRSNVINSGTNTASGGIGLSAARTLAFDCDVNMTGASGGATASGILVFASGCVADSCRIKCVSASCAGINGFGAATIFGNTIYGSGAGGIGIKVDVNSASCFIRSNTIVGCGGDGIDFITGMTGIQKIIGNMITDQIGVGIDMFSTANAGFIAYNRLRDNSSSINSGTDWVAATSYGQASLDTGTTGTTATDYVNYAGNNFRLLSTSPATSTSKPESASVGALQRDQTGAVGGSTGYSATFAQ